MSDNCTLAHETGKMGSMGEVFAGRYELVDPLASGGGGVIWRVWDLRHDEYRAGKVLKQSHSDSLIRFMRETSWRVEHEHVITPLGWVGEDDKVMFTMPLIRGGSLAQIIKEQGALPPSWAVLVIDQLLQALEAVHNRGLVHRDIKPANILLDPSDPADNGMGAPMTYLSDFGIAAPVGDPRMTRATEVIGTPGYMSPEATYGADPTPQQDLYAVGVVLLEMLTGTRPPADGIPEIPAAAQAVPLGRFIAKLFDEETKRYQTASSAREALRATQLPAATSRPIVIPDRIPDYPEGWGESGPISGNRASTAPVGGSSTSVPAGQQLPMQPAALMPAHQPAPGWGAGDTGGPSASGTRPGPMGSPNPELSPYTGPNSRRPMTQASPVPLQHQPAAQQPMPGHQPPSVMPDSRAHLGGPVPANYAQPPAKRGLVDRLAAMPEWIGWSLLVAGLLMAALALWQLA